VLLDVVGVDECRLDAQLGQPRRKEPDDSAINIALRHDVVSRLHQRENRSRDRGHTGREQQGGVGAFQFGDGIFDDGIGGIAVTGVEAVGGNDAHLLLHVGGFEG